MTHSFVVAVGALQEVERTASHINGLVQEQENMEKMIQLQRSLHHGRPGIITPGRKFLKEGILMKVMCPLKYSERLVSLVSACVPSFTSIFFS